MSTSEGATAARVERVSKRYAAASGDVLALEDVSAAFGSGTLSVVAGPSGSGKSTLLRLLAGLDHPDEGELEVAGVRVHPAPGRVARRLRRGTVGYLFQRPSDNFLPHLTVEEHLAMATAVAVRRADGAEIVERLGIASRVGHLPSQLSGGEQQRAAIAQVLLSGSRVILADEPTASLDTSSSERLLEVMRPFVEEGVAFIVASHDPLVRRAADHLVELDHGRVAGSPSRSPRRVVRAAPMPSQAVSTPSGGSQGLRWSRRRSEPRYGGPQAPTGHAPTPGDAPGRAAPDRRRRTDRPRHGDVVVEVEGVTKSYRRGEEEVHAVREVSFVARPGEFAGLFGRSGSGKTTLLNLIAGWERPDDGRVVVAGGTTRSWSEVAVLPQKLGLFDELTVRGNVEYPARVAGRLAELGDHVEGLLEALGLTAVQDRHPRETSVGEQQRCALARALVLSSRLVLADEPTGHQDHDSGRAVFRALERATLEGTTCIAATHNEEILPYLDRVFAMSDGGLSEESLG